MPKFRYYMVSLFDGAIKGTNDRNIAEGFNCSCDDFIIDTETNEWMYDIQQKDGCDIVYEQIPEYKVPK